MNKRLWGLFRKLCESDDSFLWVVVITLLIAFSTSVVYMTEEPSSLVLLLYIPIFIAIFVFGIKGGLIASLFAGLAVGPLAVDAATHGIEQTALLVLRIVIAVLIVLVVGGLVERVKKLNEIEKMNVYEDITTGYYNFNKFKIDLDNLINIDKFGSVSIILLKYENIEMIKRHVDFETSLNSYIQLHKMAEEYFNMGTIYTILGNKIAVLLPGVKVEEARNLSEKFILNTKNPVYIHDLPISLVIKSGIVNYPDHETNVDKLIIMLDKALDQSSTSFNDIEIYNNEIEKEKERYYRDLVSMYHALKNNMFTLAFQPVIDIKKNQIICAEALLRWNDLNYSNMSVLELIKIAENAGFINEITRWLFNSVTEQLKIWKEKGIELTISMNISSMDLADESFIDYVKNYIQVNNLNPKYIEFELSERSIILDENVTSRQLRRLRNAGIKLSLDDYGTGYNSLKNLISFAGKFDNLKIDKMFIDRILKYEKLILVDCIIKAAHRLGMKVIAEGVEIKEQLEILNNIDCDMVQGFYYSKPMTAEEMEKYILGFY